MKDVALGIVAGDGDQHLQKFKYKMGWLGVDSGVMAWFVAEAYAEYGDKAAFTSNDAQSLATAIYSTPPSGPALSIPSLPSTSHDQIRLLITRYRFVPLRTLIPHPEEIVYRIAELDPTLLDDMLSNGWRADDDVNAGVMRRVVTATDLTGEKLKGYLDRGFVVTPRAIKAALRKCDEVTLGLLKEHVEDSAIRKGVEEVMADNFGPDFTFSSTLATWLKNALGEDGDEENNGESSGRIVERALFLPYHSDEHSDDDEANSTTTSFPLRSSSHPPPRPLTRCFRQLKPAAAWRWVLSTYGPLHPLSMACFADALLRMGSPDEGGGASLTAVVPPAYEFLDAGTRFHPTHVGYLTAIATAGGSGFAILAAHDLLQSMRWQVLHGSSKVDDDDGGCEEEERNRMAWEDAFEVEVERMRVAGLVREEEDLRWEKDREGGEHERRVAVIERELFGNEDLESDNLAEDQPPPVWAAKSSNPRFPAGWFLKEMEVMLAELRAIRHRSTCSTPLRP